MAQFGPNGTVAAPVAETSRDYAGEDRPRIKRVILASFLCSIAAPVSVTLIAVLIAFCFSTAAGILGVAPSRFTEAEGIMSGAFVAVMVSAFNLLLFYIVIPVTWLVLAFSIGTFPRRGISHYAPYYRWASIWGGCLVGAPTLFFGLTMGNGAWIGALATGMGIGALAGLVCAALFLAIVRPRNQITTIATDDF